jgi:GDP-D-mannose dehydratase
MEIDYSSLKIKVDQTLVRPTDPAKIVGDHSRLSEDTDWQPKFELDKTITDIISS